MDYVWELIQPWVAALGGVTGCAAIIFAFIRLILAKTIKKNEELLDRKYDINTIADKVASRLAGKTLNIDVTAVTEKALKKTAAQLGDRVERVEDVAASLQLILIAIAKGIVRFKALTDEERAELVSAIQRLDGGRLKPKQDEIMTVMLQPVALPEETTEETEEDATGANFDGLEG